MAGPSSPAPISASSASRRPEPLLPDVLDVIESGDKPVVAAIHGTALGGGFEVALACHARIMAQDAAVGLPEVKLGIIPGAGGTQRLPRLVGTLKALDLVTSGRFVKADEAAALGIADEVAQGDLRSAAMALARRLAGREPRRTSALPVPAFDEAAFDKAAQAVAARARGQISPVRAAEAVRLATRLPFAEGLARERAIFSELRDSPQARALRHAFFAEREVTRVPHLDGVKPRPVSAVGVIGAGTMGAGIAVAFADARFTVTVVETSTAAVGAGWDRISGLWDRQVKSGRITEEEKLDKLGRVTVTDDFAALAGMDLVVEAAFEDMAVKHDIFGRLSAIAKPRAVLATNTSYLDIDRIAAATSRAQDIIGLHFFSPANVMRLVEVVEGEASAPDAVATGVAVAKALGKLPVACGVCDGFVGNRILSRYRQVAEFALEDGASPEDVDAVLVGFGFPMGPFAVSDLAGLDIARARRKRLEAQRDPRVRYASTLADRLCELGRFGQKTGAGWYRYVQGKREADPAVTALIAARLAERGIGAQALDRPRLERRIRATIVNEGARILAEGIVPRALDIDMVLVHGYGYPAWRGGPMFEADEIGTGEILEDMREVHAAFGFGWEPAPLLVEIGEAGRRFGDLPAMRLPRTPLRPSRA